MGAAMGCAETPTNINAAAVANNAVAADAAALQPSTEARAEVAAEPMQVEESQPEAT